MAETMQAGRELDALVAERVLCATWKRHEEATADWLAFDHDGPHGNPCVSSWVLASRDRDGDVEIWWNCPNYSTDIAPAWQVVEKLTRGDWPFFTMQRVEEDQPDDGWYAMFSSQHGFQFAETAPLAICLAALKAVSRVDADSKENADG